MEIQDTAMEEPVRNEFTCEHKFACDDHQCCPCPNWSPMVDRGRLEKLADILDEHAKETEKTYSCKKWPTHAIRYHRQCVGTANAIRECIGYDYRSYWPD